LSTVIRLAHSCFVATLAHAARQSQVLDLPRVQTLLDTFPQSGYETTQVRMLWNESLQHLGDTPVEQNRVFSTDDKFRLFLPDPGSTRSQLARVIFLARDPNAQAQPALQPLPLVDAIAGLMDMTHVGYVPALAGNSPPYSSCVPVSSSTRTPGASPSRGAWTAWTPSSTCWNGISSIQSPNSSRKGAEHERPRPVPPKPAPAAWRLPMNKVSLLIA
jgi:hypothetical protein